MQEILLTEEKIRGIYGIYKIDGRGLETCIYVGKSNNILVRLLGGDGRVCQCVAACPIFCKLPLNVLHTDIQSGIIRPKKGGVDYGS